MKRWFLLIVLVCSSTMGQDYKVEVSNPDLIPFEITTPQGTITINLAHQAIEAPEVEPFESWLYKVDASANIQWIQNTSYGQHEFSIATDLQTYQVTASTKFGLLHGCAELLRRLGFVVLGPEQHWQFLPPSLIEVEVAKTVPRFHSVNYFLTYGHRTDIDEKVSEFFHANGFSFIFASGGHAWGNVISRNLSAFEADPELYKDPAIDPTLGIPSRSLNIVSDGTEADSAARQRLIELCAADRMKWLDENPLRYAAPFDPKDGDQHSTNEVIAFTNEVAAKMKPTDSLAIYAYANHTAPPTIDVADNVMVQVKLAFPVPNGLTREKLIQGWGEKVKQLGLRDYLDVPHWSYGNPSSRICSIDYLHDKYQAYADQNATTLTSESTAFFVAHSLGLYHLGHVIRGPGDRDAITDRYFEIVWNNDLSARALFEMMYANPHIGLKYFETAIKLTQSIVAPNEAMKRRVEDLQIYFVIQYYLWKFQQIDRPETGTEQSEYWDALENYMSACWTYRNTGIVHFYAMARRHCNSNVLSLGRNEFAFNHKPNPIWARENEIHKDQVENALVEITQALSAIPTYSSTINEYESVPGVDGFTPEHPGKMTRYQARLYVVAGTTLRCAPAIANQEFTVNGTTYSSQVDIAFPEAGIVTVDGATRTTRLMAGNCAIYAGPDRPAWIDSGLLEDGTVSSDLWGFTDRADLIIERTGSATTYHLIDGKVVRFNDADGTYDFPVNQAYRLQRVNNRGQTTIKNSVPWLSFRRDKMLLPQGVIN